MMLARTKAALWIGVCLALCAIVACTVTVDPDAKTITIANQTFPIPLGLEGVFELLAGAAPAKSEVMVQKLFTGTPEEEPGTAVISLAPSGVTVSPLSGMKGAVANQVISGSADLEVYIDSASSTTPCMTGEFIGTFHLTFTDGVVTIDSMSLELSPAALGYVLGSSFTMCLQMTGTVNMTVTISGLDIEFGPPEDEVECTTDADCGTGETCLNGQCEPAVVAECVFNSDCEDGEICVNGECEPETTAECAEDSDCDAGEVCEDGECVPEPTPECVFNSDCLSGEICVNGECVPEATPECTTDADCEAGEVCTDGDCVPEAGPECVTDAECEAGEVCTDGECVPEAGPECITDADCAAGEVCTGGECVPEAVQECTLTIAIEGMGSVDPPGGTYDPGTPVTLTATATESWRFDRWEGDVTGSDNPVMVTVNADTTITAVFVEVVTSAITFRATYDRLWDTGDQNPGYGILHSAMSCDGNRLVWAIQDNDTGALSILTMNVDGSDQTIIPVPAEVDSILEVAINYDGSRAFFRRWFDLVYKVEGGTITQILDIADVSGMAGAQSLQPTATGDYVYFLEDDINDNDVWRISHAGGTPELVVNDTEVILHNGFPASQVADYSVSGDGGSLVFTTHAYWDDGYHSRSEMFIQTGGAYTQLTTDGDDYTKSNPRISGDGSIIVFSRNYSWYSMSPDGANELELGPAGYNLGGPELIYDGSKMFYSDSESSGTVILNTDGSGRQNIVPAWNITNIAIGATQHHAISDDATRVSFYTQYGVFPENAAFYVGYLENPDIIAPTVADGPFVDSIAFSPGSFPRSRPDATLFLHAFITDPDGLTDVTNTSVDAMIDGVHASYDDVPAYFYHSPRDDGEWPDDVAADGVFISSVSTGDMLDTLDAVTIRVSTMDSDKTITLADTVLTIGP